MLEKYGHDTESGAAKVYVLKLLAEGRDVGIYEDGERLPRPPQESIEEAKAILGKKREALVEGDPPSKRSK